MANRFILNEMSYHGHGAIENIASKAKATGNYPIGSISKRLKSFPIGFVMQSRIIQKAVKK